MIHAAIILHMMTVKLSQSSLLALFCAVSGNFCKGSRCNRRSIVIIALQNYLWPRRAKQIGKTAAKLTSSQSASSTGGGINHNSLK